MNKAAKEMSVKEAEKQYWNQAVKSETRKPIRGFYRVAETSRAYYQSLLLSECPAKKVLEYGCGTGSHAVALARHGAKVTGIDIADVPIDIAKARARDLRLNDIVFCVMDAEAMQFENDSFDLVCGTSVLHHLQMDKALSELARVLSPEGKAIFIEPMGYNPAINLFRKLTPHLRSRDEHPLILRDLRLMEEFFDQVNCEFFHLTSLLTIPLRNTQAFSLFYKLLDSFDRRLFKWVPTLELMAWLVVITLEKPNKESGNSS